MPRCQATKANGAPCERIVGTSQTYCFAHDQSKAEARRKAASKAGSSKPGAELREAKKKLKEYIEAVVENELDKGKASVAFQGYGVLCKFLEQERKQRELEDLERRLSELEELLEHRRTHVGP